MKRGSTYFIIFVLALALFFGVYSLTYSKTKTKLLPLAVSVIMFILGGIQLGTELLERSKAQENKEPKDISSKADKRNKLLPYVIYFAWLLGLILGIYFLGFLISIPVFIFLFLLSHGQIWYKSASTAAITTIMLYVFFVVLFKFNLYKGLIIKMLS